MFWKPIEVGYIIGQGNPGKFVFQNGVGTMNIILKQWQCSNVNKSTIAYVIYVIADGTSLLNIKGN